MDTLLTEWARLVLASFADAGVTDVVASPGSRNTPFLLAAAAEPRLRVHDAIDERAGGFFALGQARVTGRPSLLLCTSGTAGAHYAPAVIEAAQSYTPVVVMTADRPFELMGCAAAQTIDQQKLFGDHARAFFELGMPDAAPGAMRAARRMASQAVFASSWPLPGPVQVNARARKPLEPIAPSTDVERALHAAVDALLCRPVARGVAPLVGPDPAACREVAKLIASARRGLITCGPAPLSAGGDVAALAAACGYPVCAEAASQLRFRARAEEVVWSDHFDVWMRARRHREALLPEVIVQVGPPPTSSGYEQLLFAHPEIPRIVIAPHGWNDPSSGDALHLVAPPSGLAVLAEAVRAAGCAEDRAWTARIAAVEREASRAVEAALEAGAFGEGRAARTVVEALPEGALLALGNSLPIRLADTFTLPSRRAVGVLSQRGANGIDGLVAGAAGAAVSSARPTALLLGDVSLLHDVGGLWCARAVATPLAVVVIDNQGGRIFEQLPIARSGAVSPAALAHVVTPHDLDVGHAAALYGLEFARAETPEALRAALGQALARAGCTVIAATVPPHGAAEEMRRVSAEMEASPIP